MDESTSVAVSILNDLLAYDKIESGLMVLERLFVQASRFILKSVRLFRVQASHKNIELNIINRLDEGQHVIHIDESKLAQVLRNIVSNAIKFTPEHGKVDVAFFEEGGWVCVEVTDSGSGISDENQRKLFANVVQFNARAQQGGGGSGLGLWISAKIMSMHGGNIGVRSQGEGKGSTFFVKLPLVQSGVHLQAEVSMSRMSIRVHPEVSLAEKVRRRFSLRDKNNHIYDDRLRILIADDSALNRRIISRLLADEDISIDEADDGDIALEMADAKHSGATYDLILMDNLMPRMTGPVASRELRTRGYEGVIVGVTGNVAAAEVEDFIQHGVDAVLPKPVNVNDLRELIALIQDDRRQTLLAQERLRFDVELEGRFRSSVIGAAITDKLPTFS